METAHNDWGGASGLNALVVAIHVVGGQGETYTSDQVNSGALGEGDVSVDPRFVDLAAGDFRLQPGSPLIDTGTDVGVPPPSPPRLRGGLRGGYAGGGD